MTAFKGPMLSCISHFLRNIQCRSTMKVCHLLAVDKFIWKQECILVGCVPSAAVAISEGGIVCGGGAVSP